MPNNELEKKLKNLSKMYHFDIKKIKEWYELLKEYPFVKGDRAISCLSVICQRRMADRLYRYYTHNKMESLKQSIDFALYDVYGGESITFLNDNFVDYCPFTDLDADLIENYTLDENSMIENFEYYKKI